MVDSNLLEYDKVTERWRKFLKTYDNKIGDVIHTTAQRNEIGRLRIFE